MKSVLYSRTRHPHNHTRHAILFYIFPTDSLLAMQADQLWLRIIQINDVYELKNFPHFKTLVEEEKVGPDKTLVILTGDFLAPSILSSLDKGRGMVDTLNACGITHVCLGNHECDVGNENLALRISESNFTWVNTNMRELDKALGVSTLPHDIIHVTNDKYSKRVALLGLLTEDPSLYLPGSFGNVTIEPIIQCTKEYLKVLQPLDLDLIIPLTHQRICFDRVFCKEFGDIFPIVVGGHDHEPYDETHRGSRVIKTGMNAEATGIIDIKWSIDGGRVAEKPHISVKLIPTQTYEADQVVKERVKVNESIIQELERAKLFRFVDWLPKGVRFSTENNRLQPTSGCTVLCTLLRMGMNCDCCLINAGDIRAGKVYDLDQEWFTWNDLNTEMVFPNNMLALEIPGKVIEDVINYSRRHARLDPPITSGGYLQHCDGIEYDNDTQKILSIQGEVFDPERCYLTTLPGEAFDGIDNLIPLLEWGAENHIHNDQEHGQHAKPVVVETCAILAWLKFGRFEDVDTNGDGVLTIEEVRNKAMDVFGDDITDLVINSIFGIADMDKNGMITPVQMKVVQFVASHMRMCKPTAEEIQDMRNIAEDVLAKVSPYPDVNRTVQKLRHILEPGTVAIALNFGSTNHIRANQTI